MKLQFPKKLTEGQYVAVSGGADSMALLHSMIMMGKKPKIAHFVHDDPYAKIELDFVSYIADRYDLEMVVAAQSKTVYVGSREKIWRDARYEFFKSLGGVVNIGTNLDDAVEWYIMTCLRGEGHFMSYENENVMKPLLLTRKTKIYEYLEYHKLKWLEDPSNHDGSNFRSKIRQKVIPAINSVDPGLMNMVRKRILNKIQF